MTDSVVYYSAEIITAVKCSQYRLLISTLHRPLAAVINVLVVEAACGLTNAITKEH